MKTLNVFASLIFAFATLTACGANHSADPGSGGTTNSTAVVNQLRYYKGGGLPVPNQPSWSYDLTIDFTDATAFQITAKTATANCLKTGVLSPAQSTQLNQLVSSLTLQWTTTAPPMDAGEEFVEFENNNNSTSKIYLDDTGAPNNAVYASNGADLGQFLQTLVSGLTLVCD